MSACLAADTETDPLAFERARVAIYLDGHFTADLAASGPTATP